MIEDDPLTDQEIEQASRDFCVMSNEDPDQVISYDGHNPYEAGKHLWEVASAEIIRADRIRVSIAMQLNKRTEKT
jgi:hypothetical protein